MNEAGHLFRHVSFQLYVYFSVYFFVSYLINQVVLRKRNNWLVMCASLAKAWVWAAGGVEAHWAPRACMPTRI